MKITIVTPLFPPEIGGPATYVVPLALGLKKKGHEVKIITLCKEHPKQKYGLEVYSIIRQGEIMNSMRIVKALSQYARDSDLIYGLDIAAIGSNCVVFGNMFKIPVAIRYAGDTAWEKARRENTSEKELEPFLKDPDANPHIIKIQKEVLKYCSLVITPSKYLKRIIHECYGIEDKKIVAINNAIHAPNNDAIGSDKCIAYGRYVPWKRFDRIIEAFSRMPKREILIIGDGPLEKELRAQAKPYKNIRIAGKLSNAMLMNILTCSKAFILNSSYEGMSHSILEAFSEKVPVIASDIEPNKELIEDKVNGLLIPSEPREENIKALIEVVEKLDNQKLMKTLRTNGYNKVATEHSWENNVKQTEIEFKKVIKC